MDILKNSLFLAIVGGLCAFSITFVFDYTNEIVAQSNSLKESESLEKLFENGEKFAIIENEFNVDKVIEIFSASKNNEITGYGFKTSTEGYQSTIVLLVAIDKNGKYVGVEILEIADTPGIGMKVKEESFLSQFKGKKSINDKMDSISGATYTLKGVEEGLNAAIEVFKIINK